MYVRLVVLIFRSMITGVLFMYIMYIELFHGAQMNDITLTLKLRNSLADLSKNSPQAITL